MINIIENLLPKDQVNLIAQFLRDQTFKDGKLSAVDVAKSVKNNDEIIAANQQEFKSVNTIVMNAITSHPSFRASVMMQKMGAPIFARYKPGMYYGDHLDNPIMGQPGQYYRTDISMTLFLNEPEEYQGGELHLNSDVGEQEYKLPAGSLITYPSTLWHRVNEVTEGERLVCVTWAQSMVKDPRKREVLFNLHQANHALVTTQGDSKTSKQVNYAYNRLVQMWSDV